MTNNGKNREETRVVADEVVRISKLHRSSRSLNKQRTKSTSGPFPLCFSTVQWHGLHSLRKRGLCRLSFGRIFLVTAVHNDIITFTFSPQGPFACSVAKRTRRRGGRLSSLRTTDSRRVRLRTRFRMATSHRLLSSSFLRFLHSVPAHIRRPQNEERGEG